MLGFFLLLFSYRFYNVDSFCDFYNGKSLCRFYSAYGF